MRLRRLVALVRASLAFVISWLAVSVFWLLFAPSHKIASAVSTAFAVVLIGVVLTVRRVLNEASSEFGRKLQPPELPRPNST